MTTYNIERFYLDRDKDTEVVKTGLSLQEAQAHCRDPETSSSTATTPEALARTQAHGFWFDGCEEEE